MSKTTTLIKQSVANWRSSYLFKHMSMENPTLMIDHYAWADLRSEYDPACGCLELSAKPTFMGIPVHVCSLPQGVDFMLVEVAGKAELEKSDA